MNKIHNVAQLVRRAATQVGDRPALIYRGQTLTWAEVDAEVDAVARDLSTLFPSTPSREGSDKVPPRVAIALPNIPRFVTTYFGILRAGLIAVPIHPGQDVAEQRRILADSGASAVVCGATTAARLIGPEAEGVLDGVRHILTVEDAPEAKGDTGPLQVSPDEPPLDTSRGGEDLAVILYTSGTSGVPHGVMLSHRALMANLQQLDQIEPRMVSPTDVVLLALPMFHAYGLGPGLHEIAYHGCAGVLIDRFDPADTLEQIERHRVSVVLGVPAMYRAWLRQPDLEQRFSGVRLAVSGAAPLDPRTWERFAEITGRHIFVGYGLTEAAPVLTTTLCSQTNKIGSIGRPIPGVELKLVSPDGQEIEAADHDDHDDEEFASPQSPGTDPGEIWVRGKNLFSGYWPDGRGGPGADGWWATADLAYADADGDLFLVDRLSDVITVSGFSVYPQEVERILLEHPAVAEAAVVGVPHPTTGQAIRAYLVTREGTSVDADEMIAHCERRLARFKSPTEVRFVDQLPRSITGQVRRSMLRDR